MAAGETGARPHIDSPAIAVCRRIIAVDGDLAVTRRSQAKFATTQLLLDTVYGMLCALKAKYRGRQSRQVRCKIAAAQG